MEFKCYLTLLLAFTVSTIDGQSIISSPSDTAGIVGGTASFTCEIEFSNTNLMQWEFQGTPVYTYENGNEDYPNGGAGKYSVEQDGRTFTLTVTGLTYDDGDIYTCWLFGITPPTAHLIVFETPIVNTDIADPLENTIASYSCEGRFGGPDDLLPEDEPELQMYLNGQQLSGTVQKTSPEGPINYYIYRMETNVTLQANMDGVDLICDIRTSQETAVTGSAVVQVLYSVRDTNIALLEDQLRVGDVLNCTAGGNPTPTYEWTESSGNGNGPVNGQFLQLTEEMIGINNWKCTSSNTIASESYIDEDNAEFSVESNTQPSQGAGGDSWKIAVGVAVPICIIIIGAIVGLLVYTFVIKKKKQPARPTNNLPMNNSMNGNQKSNKGYKDSMEEEDGYYPEEKVPAFTIHSPNRYQNAPNLPFNGQGTPPPYFQYQTNLLGTGIGSNHSLPLDDTTPDNSFVRPTPTNRTKSQEALDGARAAHVSFDRNVRDDDDDDDDNSMPPTPPPPMHGNNVNQYRPAALPATIPPPDTTV